MAWVFEDEIVEEAPKQPTKTSAKRLLGGTAREVLGRGLGAAAEAFGSSWYEQQQQGQEQQYEELADYARQQGMSEEDILSNLGPPPTPSIGVMGGIDELTGGQLIPQTPLEKAMAGAAGGATEFAVMEGMLPGGSSLGKMQEAGKIGAKFGLGESAAEQMGFGQLGQLAGGFAGIYGAQGLKKLSGIAEKGKNLFNSAVEFGKDLLEARGKMPTSEVPEFMKEVGTEKALADLELSQKELTKRTSQVSNADLETFKNLSDIAEEGANIAVDSFNAATVEKNLQQANRESILDTVSLVDASPKESWEEIMKNVEDRFEAVRESYGELYNAVERKGADIKLTPQNMVDSARKLSDQTSKSLLKMPEEQSLQKAAAQLIEKVAPDQTHLAKRLVEDLSKENVYSDFNLVLKELNEIAMKEGTPKAITLDKAMATKRAINRVLAKADIIPAPVNLLKPLGRAIKQDIIEALKPYPFELDMFEKAEALFAKTQDVFNNPNMVIARKSELPERLNTIFDKPSNLEKLNEALGEGSPYKRVADRMLVDEISRSSTPLAKEKAKQLRAYLDPRADTALEELIKLKDSRTAIGSIERTRGRILDSLQEASTNGTRPQYVLDLMKTRNGRALVDEVLSHSPKGRQMAQKLNSMLFGDIINNIIKEDSIDYSKLNKLIADGNSRNIIVKEMGGEGLRDLQTIATRQVNMKKNLQILSERQPGLYRELMESDTAKKLIYLLAGLAAVPSKGLSAIPAIGIEVYGLNERRKLLEILKEKETRYAVKTLSNSSAQPKDIAKAIKILIFASERED